LPYAIAPAKERVRERVRDSPPDYEDICNFYPGAAVHTHRKRHAKSSCNDHYFYSPE